MDRLQSAYYILKVLYTIVVQPTILDKILNLNNICVILKTSKSQ